MRRIVSIWLPAWPIERLARRNRDAVPLNSTPGNSGLFNAGPGDAPRPDLTGPDTLSKDRAFALVLKTARGLVITAVNPCACAEGLSAGMTLADARALLPSLLSAPARREEDHAGLQALARWCGRYGPARNIDTGNVGEGNAGKDNIDGHINGGVDALEHGIWIDVTGVADLFARMSAQQGQSDGPKLLDRPKLPDRQERLARPSQLETQERRARNERLLLADMAKRLHHFGLTSQIAIADSYAAAYALARFGIRPDDAAGGGIAIAPPGETRGALRHLPVDGLRLEAPTVLLLKRLGLRRIGQLYDLPRAALERRFYDHRRRGSRRGARRSAGAATQAVLLRLDQALGLSAEPRRAMSESPQYLIRRDYPELLISSEALHNEILQLAADLCDEFAAAKQGARQLRLSLYRADGTCARLEIGTSSPCRAADHVMRLFSEKLDRVDAGFGIDLLSLEALQVEPLLERQDGFSMPYDGSCRSDVGNSNVGGSASSASVPNASVPNGSVPNASVPNGSLVDGSVETIAGGAAGATASTAAGSLTAGPLAPVPDDDRALARLIDLLGNRLGGARVLSLEARASHIPERAQVLTPMSQQAVMGHAGWSSETAKSSKAGQSFKAGQALGARKVSAGGQIAPHLTPRPPLLLPYPEPIAVIRGFGTGPPISFTWRRMTRSIALAQGPERIAAEWWRDLQPPGEAHGQQEDEPTRDYYSLEDDAGGRYWVFCAGLHQCAAGKDTGRAPPAWYMHGLFG